MPGPIELLILGVVMALAGGGGSMMALLKREATKRAKSTLEQQVRAVVPDDLQQAAGQVDAVVRQVRGQEPRPARPAPGGPDEEVV